MEYLLLSDVSSFSGERISIEHISEDNYISTENMIPERGGVCSASSLPDAKKVSKYSPGDILLSNIRPYFKKIWYADKVGGCSNDVLVVHPKKNIDGKFLYYVLSDNNFFNYDTLTAKGTKMPRGTKHAIMKYWVPNVTHATQQKIASILSAYDSQIENNQKRIKLLEQMAENLYKEWFVRFRFPGYENAEFEGGVPKGWKICRLGQIAKISAGGDAPKDMSESCSEDYPYPIYSNGIKDEGLYGFCKRPIIAKNTITISARGTVGYVAFREEPFLPIVRLISVHSFSEGISPFWLYFYLKNESIDGYGTSQQQITIPFIERKKVIVPTHNLQVLFENQVSTLFAERRHLKKLISHLTTQRDLLLPRLMSGKINI